ncbi:MAG: 2-isopropylmalate synthase [Candidatus Sumerlaeota bacterium]|nr:2-isopropylmalate synthase [Candidatus Sumerlaeota bacterium]
MSQDRVIIFDTTLRDGEQSPGCSMNQDEKLKVARQLARLGVDVIEAGFPISSPGDFESVKRVATEIEGPVICGLARALEKDIRRAGEALAPAKRRRIHTFIATSDVHVEKKLRMSREQVIQAAVRSVQLAKTFTDDVEFSPEDAGRTGIDYMIEICLAAVEAGATTLNIPDTVGYCSAQQYGERIAQLAAALPKDKAIIISTHCHNDLGMAVANSLAGVVNGARQVECTINGIGERAGNCSLEEVVMNLKVRHDYYRVGTSINTREIYRTSRLVSQITGSVVQPNKAIVGANAFAHEAGIHQDGILKERTTYEIMRPDDVGWVGEHLVMGKHSGRHAFATRLAALGFDNLSDEQLNRAFDQFKVLCDRKKEVYDDDLYAIVEVELTQAPSAFTLEFLEAETGTDRTPHCRVRVKKDSEERAAEATGDGPVDAAYKAIERAVGIETRLVDYHIEAVTGGQDALGRVNVTIAAGDKTAKGTGASTDVVIASALAFLNAANRLRLLQEAANGAAKGNEP